MGRMFASLRAEPVVDATEVVGVEVGVADGCGGAVEFRRPSLADDLHLAFAQMFDTEAAQELFKGEGAGLVDLGDDGVSTLASQVPAVDLEAPEVKDTGFLCGRVDVSAAATNLTEAIEVSDCRNDLGFNQCFDHFVAQPYDVQRLLPAGDLASGLGFTLRVLAVDVDGLGAVRILVLRHRSTTDRAGGGHGDGDLEGGLLHNPDDLGDDVTHLGDSHLVGDPQAQAFDFLPVAQEGTAHHGAVDLDGLQDGSGHELPAVPHRYDDIVEGGGDFRGRELESDATLGPLVGDAGRLEGIQVVDKEYDAVDPEVHVG